MSTLLPFLTVLLCFWWEAMIPSLPLLRCTPLLPHPSFDPLFLIFQIWCVLFSKSPIVTLSSFCWIVVIPFSYFLSLWSIPSIPEPPSLPTPVGMHYHSILAPVPFLVQAVSILPLPVLPLILVSSHSCCDHFSPTLSFDPVLSKSLL